MVVSFIKRLPIGYSSNYRTVAQFLPKVNISIKGKENFTYEFFGTFGGITFSNGKKDHKKTQYEQIKDIGSFRCH